MPSKRKEKQEVITTRGICIYCSYPSRYKPCPTGLNFVEGTTRGAVLAV